MTTSRILVAVLAVLTLLGAVPPVRAAEEPGGEAAPPVEWTPPRLSFTSGQVSFWRPGAADWTPALVNTPLTPGDVLYVSAGGNVEVEIDARAFVRASGNTQVGLDNLEPDFVQFRLTAGHLGLDLREVRAGHTVEIDTPGAVFTIERPGYYVVDVTDDTTTFVTRRGGRATVTPAGGSPQALAPSEQVVVTGTDAARVETYVAPELTEWDRWNYARTDALLEAVSARYVPPGVYGASELDRYGVWRVVPDYGSVWIPSAVPAGWVPYSTGRWVWDPIFGWTWVDDAPWGWAPFHYGRWVFVSGRWAWAPGSVVVRPRYAPALVVFFGHGHAAVAASGPVSWVALGWGEPLVPWWGPAGFIGRPWWAGWGGPRVINNVVVQRTTVVHVTQITHYRNVPLANAVVTVSAGSFGHREVKSVRVTHVDVRALTPIHGPLQVRPSPVSLAPGTGAAARPPEALHRRGVVATRPPRDTAPLLRQEGITPGSTATSRVIEGPRREETAAPAARPPYGRRTGPERAQPPQPPGPDRFRRSTPTAPRATVGRIPTEPRPSAGRVERERSGAPGGPATSQAPAGRTESGRSGSPAGPAPVAPRATGPARPSTPPGTSRPDVRAAPPSTPGARDGAGGPATKERGTQARRAAPEDGAASHAPTPSGPGVGRPRRGQGGRDLPGEPANRLYQGRPGRERGRD